MGRKQRAHIENYRTKNTTAVVFEVDADGGLTPRAIEMIMRHGASLYSLGWDYEEIHVTEVSEE